MKKLLVILALAVTLPLGPALAHPGGPLEHGLAGGFLHPLLGMDHLVVMVTVGLWAGLLGGTARLALPGAFLGAMTLGMGLGMAGLAMPGIEAGLLASVLLLGVLAALAVRTPLRVAAPLVGLAGLLHGHAHGVEAGAVEVTYAVGALAATAVLHGIGLLLARPLARLLPRARVA
jgi:urease accessory protein